MDSGVLFALIGIVICLVCSAFFSGAETAITAVSRARMHALEKKGNRRAALVNKIREKKDRVIGALLIANNFVNISASALATGIMITLYGQAGVAYATLAMTVVLVIFSEVMPKTYAVHNPDRTAMAIAPMLTVVTRMLSPLTAAVAWIVHGVLRLAGVNVRRAKPGSHLDLLRGAIDLHHGSDEGTQAQRAMLRSILDLFDVTVEDIMIHRRNVLMINGDQSVSRIVEDVLETPYTRLPVWKGDPDNIIGILHVKQMLKALNQTTADPDSLPLKAIVSEPWFVPETTNLFDQLETFRQRREHFAIVVDEYGALMGIVTLEDILEEIVGQIDDEHDVSVPGVKRVKGGRYVVEGNVTIRDLNREYEWHLPDEEYSTLAGLLLYEARTIPETGQSFLFHGFQFDVLKRHRNQIMQVRITPPARPRKKKKAPKTERPLPPERSAAAAPG